MEEEEYEDIWRLQHPTERFFTHMTSGTRNSWSRIDYFLISKSVQPYCMESGIKASVCSDHSMIYIDIVTDESKRGPGIWKFNNKLLEDPKFIAEIKDMINQLKSNYGYMSGFNMWELIKFEIKQFSRDWAVNVCLQEKERRMALYEKMCELQDTWLKEGDDVNAATTRELLLTTNEIKQFETIDAKKAAFRCKKEWIQGGDKQTKYFFNLEKRKYKSKTMYAVRKPDGTLTKDYTEILQVQYNFYNDLFTSNDEVKFTLSNETEHVLDEATRSRLDAAININELYDAMMALRSNKTPGCDGLTVELYRVLWNELKNLLYQNYSEALEKGHLNDSARRGIINLIPKQGDEFDIRQWRPIALLCVDYKIWAKAISNRIEETTYLIGEQQSAFIKNRSIFKNIYTTIEVVAFLNKNWKESGVIVTVDFSKCFDRIEYSSIRGTFQYFGFRPEFIKYLFILYNNFKLCTSNNRYISKFMKKGRGTNQGCPASPLVYNFCGEIMAHLMYNNPEIQGIRLYDLKQLLGQFADDTAAFLKYERITVNAFVNTLSEVERQMGLKVSYDKTTIYRVGSLYKTNSQLITQKNFKWSDKPIELLGVKIPCDGSECKDNLNSIICKIDQVCKSWINRSATLYGKVIIINSLIGSLFVYKMMTMLYLNETEIAQVEGIISNFLWNNKKPKISLEMLKKDKKQGGLRLVDISAKQNTIWVSWIIKSLEDSFLQRCVEYNLNKDLGHRIWCCNIKPRHVSKMFQNNFWSTVLYAWAQINFRIPKTKVEVLESLLWYNSEVCKGETNMLVYLDTQRDIKGKRFN